VAVGPKLASWPHAGTALAGVSAVEKERRGCRFKMAPFQRRTTFVVRLRRVQDEICNLNMLFIYSQLASLSLMQLLRSRNMRLFFLLNIFVGTRWTKQEAEYFFSLAFDDQLRCRSGTGFLFGDPPSDHTLQFSQRQRCMTHAIWVVVSNTFYIHPYLGK